MSTDNKYDSSAYELNDRRSQDTRGCMPCVIESVSDDDCIISVTPAYSERVMDEQGRTVSNQRMSEIIDIPTPVIAGIRVVPKRGDHGIIIFADFSIDNYIVNGQFSVEEASRFHDYSDALYIPADFRCSRADKPIVTIKDGQTIFHNSVKFEGDVNFTGDADFDKDITIEGDSYANHIHEVLGLVTGPVSEVV